MIKNMQKRKWYVDPEDGSINEDILWCDKFIKECMDLYCTGQFTQVDNLNLQNIPYFLEIILKRYEEYYFNSIDLKDLGDALSTYILYADLDEFPYQESKNLSGNDRRCLGVNMAWILDDTSFTILPEDVPVLINYLHTPDDQLVGSYDRLIDYLEQFDNTVRWSEVDKRWEVITQQRIEAIARRKPMPVRPMGIELDMCYKKKDDKQET